MPALLRKLLPALTLAAMLTACESVDDDRIPYAEVHLTFHTVGDWNIYGVQDEKDRSCFRTENDRDICAYFRLYGHIILFLRNGTAGGK